MTDEPLRYPKIAVPTKSLAVVDLGRDRMDGQVAACVLQGLVNRRSERKVYVCNSYCYDNRLSLKLPQAQVAEPFLTELFADVPAERLAPADDRAWPGLLALLGRFAEFAKGLVVWDPTLEAATIEAATTVAAQTDALPVSPELAEALAGSGLPITADLREHRFRTDPQCLEWLLANWMDGACRDAAFVWEHMTTGGRSWGAANKDYVAALRLFTFHVDTRQEADLLAARDVLAHYPPGTPVMGWIDERHSAVFDDAGFCMVPYIGVENLSVQSSFASTTGVQPPPQPAELRSDGVYVAFYVADGDNLLHTLVYHPYAILHSAAYDALPVTWIINPGIVDLAPRLYEWYLARLGGQELGAQMADGHPQTDRYRFYREYGDWPHMVSGFKRYCRMTRDYLRRAGIRTLKQMGESEAVAWNVQPYMVNSGYCGGRDGRGPRAREYHMDGEAFHVGSVPLETDGGVEAGAEGLRRIVRGAPAGEPLFLNVFCGTCRENVFEGDGRRDTPAIIRQVAEALEASQGADGRRYFFLRSMDLAATYRAWRGLPVLPA
jgi:hypothetical protein